MWNNLLYRLGYERRAKEKQAVDPNAQKWDDIENINWFAMAVSKITNLSCTETTYDIKSDSALTEPIADMCNDLENKRFEIVTKMLGSGDCYVFPSFDEQGSLFHSVLSEERVVIVDTDGENITKAYAILDVYKPDKSGLVFFLIRTHKLDNGGNLTISYDSVDEAGQSQYVEQWEYLKNTSTQFAGVNHIGFGRYKSPVSSREHSDIYGVPMNFGCGEIEEQINETNKQVLYEFKNGQSKIFTDPRNLQVGKDAHGNTLYEIAENIIPLRQSEGQHGTQIDMFSPALRGSEHFEKLEKQLQMYERQMGLSPGILTENEAMATGTATAVRRSNADTIAFVNSVQNSLDKGNVMTLEADGIFLNIRRDLWEYNSDYYDVFGDSQEQWQTLVTAFDKGAVSVERLTKWLYPKMTDEQVAEELEKVNSRNDMSMQSAIERSLMQ